MKRISEFGNCRMDMKNMAALHGGITRGSMSSHTYVNCGDTMTMSWKDDRGYDGIEYEYDHRMEIIPWECTEVTRSL
jgi:hypothetical protein